MIKVGDVICFRDIGNVYRGVCEREVIEDSRGLILIVSTGVDVISYHVHVNNVVCNSTQIVDMLAEDFIGKYDET